MGQLTAIREALATELATWALGVSGLKWRGDVQDPKTTEAEDQPEDDGSALPMAGVSVPRFAYQAEDNPEIVSQATDTRGAVMRSGDSEARAQVVLYLYSRADYDAALLNFPRFWRWKALDSSEAGSALVVPMIYLELATELRCYLGDQITLAQPAPTQSRGLCIVSWDVLLRFEHLTEEPTAGSHGVQYVRVSLNGGDETGPAESVYLQLENATDLELEDGSSMELEEAQATGTPAATPAPAGSGFSSGFSSGFGAP